MISPPSLPSLTSGTAEAVTTWAGSLLRALEAWHQSLAPVQLTGQPVELPIYNAGDLPRAEANRVVLIVVRESGTGVLIPLYSAGAAAWKRLADGTAYP